MDTLPSLHPRAFSRLVAEEYLGYPVKDGLMDCSCGAELHGKPFECLYPIPDYTTNLTRALDEAFRKRVCVSFTPCATSPADASSVCVSATLAGLEQASDTIRHAHPESGARVIWTALIRAKRLQLL